MTQALLSFMEAWKSRPMTNDLRELQHFVAKGILKLSFCIFKKCSLCGVVSFAVFRLGFHTVRSYFESHVKIYIAGMILTYICMYNGSLLHHCTGLQWHAGPKSSLCNGTSRSSGRSVVTLYCTTKNSTFTLNKEINPKAEPVLYSVKSRPRHFKSFDTVKR
jgi:hypothetical protein